MTSKPDADRRLLDAHDLALAALREITPASTIGPPAGYLLEEGGAVSLKFENRLPGYPGWHWTVTVARVDDEEPTVLEVELLPGDGALLAPEWVPWAERLAEYRAHQAELAEQAAAAAADADEVDEFVAGEDDVEDLDDLDDDLDDEDDPAETRVLHAGDLDGVDIDELDDSAEDDDIDTDEIDSDDDSDDDADDDSDEDDSDDIDSDEDDSEEE